MEIWKYIDGYAGYYMVSTYGRVKALGRMDRLGRIHKPRILKFDWNNGYYRVTLSKDGKIKRYQVHRLVAQTFLEKVEGKDIVNHKNGMPTDNHPDNLEWATYQENNQHAHDTGLNKGTIGSTNGMSKLSEADALEVKYLIKSKVPNSEIAQMYNVSPRTIRDIKNNRTWKHIKIY